MPRSNKRLATILAQCNAALEAEDVEALIECSAAALDLAKNGRELWDIAGREPIALGVYDDGIFPAEIVDVIVGKARRWRKHADVRDALALVARVAAHDPGQLVLLDEEPELVRTTTRRAIAKHRRFLRDCLGARSGEVRSAAMHALAAAHEPKAADAGAVVERLAAEHDEEALATAALVAGAVVRTQSKTAQRKLLRRARPAWERARAHDSPLVRACVASGVALVDGAVQEDDARALAHVVRKPRALPESWGWRWRRRADTSGHMAVRVLSWVDTPAATRGSLAAALERHGERKSRDPRWEEALRRCGAEPGEPARKGAAGTRRTSGMGSTAAARRESFVSIWKAFFAKKLSQQEAVEAIVDGMSLREATRALTSLQRSAQVGLTAPLEKRDMDLMVATMRALAKKGDLVEAVRKCVAAGDCDEQPAAIGLLAGYEARRGAPPASDHPLIAEGLAYRPRKSSLDGLLARLGRKQQTAIEALCRQVRASG